MDEDMEVSSDEYVEENTGSPNIEVRNISTLVTLKRLEEMFTVYATPTNIEYSRAGRGTATGIAIITYQQPSIARYTASEMDDAVHPDFNDGIGMSVKQCLLLDRDNLQRLQERLGAVPESRPAMMRPPRMALAGRATVAEVRSEEASCVVTVRGMPAETTAEELIQRFRFDGHPVTVFSRSSEGRIGTARLVFHSADAARYTAQTWNGRFWPGVTEQALFVRQH